MRTSLFALALLALAGCARTATVVSDVGPREVGPTLYSADAVPTGTTLDLRLDDAVGTATSRVGDVFTATVAAPLRTRSGRTVVPAGARVTGRVTELDDSDSAADGAVVRLDFDRIEVGGRTHPFDAKVVAADVRRERGRSVGAAAGRGAVVGAVVGAVLDGADGALKGAAAGAAGGTAIALGTGDVDLALEAGTVLRVETNRRIDLR